jgi:hypothetical protein
LIDWLIVQIYHLTNKQKFIGDTGNGLYMECKLSQETIVLWMVLYTYKRSLKQSTVLYSKAERCNQESIIQRHMLFLAQDTERRPTNEKTHNTAN